MARLTRDAFDAYRRAPGLAIVIACNSFKPTRRNPDGKLVLSPDQEEALATLEKLIVNREKGKRTVLVLVGPAGTGKSTVMRELITRLEKAGVGADLMAPTGKAAARLRETTGRETSTVHRAIYGAPTQVGKCPSCGQLSPDLGLSSNQLRKQGKYNWTCPQCKVEIPLAYEKKIERSLGFQPGKGAKDKDKPRVAVVDEASMVGTKLHADALANLPPNYAILYVGDREQLPPVNDEWGPDFEHPTAALKQVHRQAAGNPIIDIATRIRNGQNAQGNPFAFDVPDPDGHVKVVRRGHMAQAAEWLAQMREHRQDATLITYTNAKRQALNRAVRQLRGLEQESHKSRLALVHADRVLMRGNNKPAGLMNGEVFVIEKAWHPESKLMREAGFQFVTLFQRGGPYLVHMPSIGIPLNNWQGELAECFRAYKEAVRDAQRFDRDFPKDADPFEELDDEELFERYDGAVRPHVAIHVDYGECVTAHTSQGSQWKNVGIVWDEATWALWEGKIGKPDEGRRWLYTAVTRASVNLRVWFVS